MICLDARHVQTALAAKANKTDKNDARGIATLLRRGVYTTAHIKSDESMRTRVLLATRRTLQRKALDLQGSIRMAVKTFGAQIEIRRRRVLVRQHGDETDEAFSDLIQVMVRASDQLLAEVAILDKLISDIAKDDPVCGRLMTIPGVGPITALTFRAGVDDPKRFKSSRTVPAHFGLTPRVFQSGQSSHSGNISRKGDGAVRAALYSAASSLLNTSRSKWSLRLWGLRLAKEKRFKVAAVACARRLAIVMHRLWVSGDVFELHVEKDNKRTSGKTLIAKRTPKSDKFKTASKRSARGNRTRSLGRA